MSKLYAAFLVAVLVTCLMLNFGEAVGYSVVVIATLGAWIEFKGEVSC